MIFIFIFSFYIFTPPPTWELSAALFKQPGGSHDWLRLDHPDEGV